MKIRKQSDLPKANKIFTDREEPRDSFWRSYGEFKGVIEAGEDIRVLTYYGIGGIGKTFLLRKLMSEMDEKLECPQYAYIDLNVSQDARTMLTSLRNILEKKYKFKFQLFDLANYVYAKKIGDKLMQEETEGINAAGGLIGSSPFLTTVMNVLGDVPVVGLISKLDKCAGYVKSWLEWHKRDVSAIECEPPETVYKKLSYYLARDIADEIEHNDEPLVIFVDTYEMLVNEMTGVGDPKNNDMWIRGEDGLVMNAPRVMWVIAGREKLRWVDFDPDWNDSMDQHILGSLSSADAAFFLTSAGITDEQLIRSIYQLTSGTPVFLDLCVDNYYSMLDNGRTPTIDDFSGGTNVLIERFMRYMDDSRKDITYLLACMKVWDDELFHSAARMVLPGYSLTTYEKIKDLSFILKNEDGTFYIHQTVQDAVYKSCPSFIKNKGEEAMISCYKARLAALTITDSDYAECFSRYVSYLLAADHSEESLTSVFNDLKGDLKKIQDAGQFELLTSISTQLLSCALSHFGKSRISVKLLDYMAERLIAAGQYGEAQTTAQSAVDMSRELFGDQDEDTISAVITLARCLRLLGNYQVAFDLASDCVHKASKYLGGEHSLTLRSMASLAICYSNLGRYEEALKTSEQVLSKRRMILGHDHPATIYGMNDLANRYKKLGLYDEALKIREEVLPKFREILGCDHPNTIRAMQGLASSYFNLGRYDEALKLIEEASSKLSAIFGDDHPHTISAMQDLASRYSALGRYDEALKIREDVLSMRREILGDSHPDTIVAMANLGISYSALGLYDEALKIREEALSKMRDLLGVDHPNTLEMLNYLADSLNKLGRYAEAKEQADTALNKMRALYGEDSIKLASVMDTLSEALSGQGRHERAVELAEHALRIVEANLGDEHPRRRKFSKYLADRLQAAGLDEREKEILKRVQD